MRKLKPYLLLVLILLLVIPYNSAFGAPKKSDIPSSKEINKLVKNKTKKPKTVKAKNIITQVRVMKSARIPVHILL